MFPRAFRVARLAGIDVRIDPSWLIIALVVVWWFYDRLGADPTRDATAALGLAVVGGALFFLSVLVHEAAHALEARHRGLTVRGITLFLFGGVTEMHLETERPVDEFAVAAVGPYLSIVCAAVFGLAATGARWAGLGAVAELSGILGWINVSLAIFNLVPGAPLDGGRVLRALLWAVTGDRHRAGRLATYAGQAVAIGLGALAVRLLLAEQDALVDALWLAFIAWFLWRAAVMERRGSATQELVAGRTVGDLLDRTPPPLPADQPLHLVTDRLAAHPGVEVFRVAPHAETPSPIVGVLRIADVLAVDTHDRPFRVVADLMRPIDEIPAVASDSPVPALLGMLDDGAVLKVVEPDGSVAGLATARQVEASLARLHALVREGRHTRRRRAPGGPTP